MGSGQCKRLTAIGINNLNNCTVKKKKMQIRTSKCRKTHIKIAIRLMEENRAWKFQGNLTILNLKQM